jgi:hypothetical protein
MNQFFDDEAEAEYSNSVTALPALATRVDMKGTDAALDALSAGVMRRLEERLQDRIGRVWRIFWRQLAVSAAFIALGGNFFLAFYEVMMGGLQVEQVDLGSKVAADAGTTMSEISTAT